VDLLVVGSAGRRDLAGALGRAEGILGREVNLNIYDPARFAAAVRDADPFVEDVLSKPKVWVVGDEGVLERMAG
jgi:hypothetical protein